MNLKLIYRNVVIAVCVFFFAACDNQWDDHVEVKNNRETETVMQVIESNPETSTFAAILKKTGYDSLLSGDKALTVFAPVNSAIGSVDMEDEDALRELVRNHIAYLSYSVVNGSFNSDTIEMINSKRLKTDGTKIDNIALKSDEYNITTANGLLHVVEGLIVTKDNIWEYLQKQSGYPQVTFIQEMDHSIMDMENSIQTGITEDGRPEYDTVWIIRNEFLEKYPIYDETRNFTFILLDLNVMNRIESKYAKYFVRPIQQEQDSIVRGELLKDCVLLPVEISSDSKYSSVDGVLMDIVASNISGSYQASNGIVYKLTDGDVKVYQNKLKDIIIEAEDYQSIYANGDSWSLRMRGWASGGQDMMLNGTTRNYFTDTIRTETDTTVVNETYSYNSGISQSGYIANVTNCYIEFSPVLNSVGYKISCVQADDIVSHYSYTSTSRSEYWYPMVLEQKLLISFADSARLERVASPITGAILHNFSYTSTFFARSQASEVTSNPAEVPFYRYNIDTTTSGSLGGFLIPGRMKPGDALDDVNIYQGSDDFGDKEVLICPRYGEASLFIANAPRETGANSGMIFLDYIRFSPVVDPND